MQIYDRSQVSGNSVSLARTDPIHFDDSGIIKIKPDGSSIPFAEVLFNAVDQANSLQQNADDLEQKMMIAPDEVNIDQVMIASEKARLTVTFMKSITEKAIKAYNDLLMLR